MNNEEAIKELQKRIDLIHWNYDELDQVLCKYKQALLKAVEALEKQISKKPKRLSYKPLIDNGWKYECPCCGLAIGENSFAIYEYIEPIEPYCGLCGQAIDWSDAE